MKTLKELKQTLGAILDEQLGILANKSAGGERLTEEEVAVLEKLTNIAVKTFEKLRGEPQRRTQVGSSLSNEELKKRLKNNQE